MKKCAGCGREFTPPRAYYTGSMFRRYERNGRTTVASYVRSLMQLPHLVFPYEVWATIADTAV